MVYQETYDRAAYAELHTAGPKKDFDWRLDCPERAYAAGFRRLGLGALFGLALRGSREALHLAAHVDYLLRHCWKSSVTVSLPRLRPAAGQFEPRHEFNDRALVQVILALRLCFPQIGIVLSTREAPALRDRLARLGVTMMSAGSHTEPGGYTGAGEESIHQTHTRQGRGGDRLRRRAPERDGAVRDCGRAFAGGGLRAVCASWAWSRCGRIGTRRWRALSDASPDIFVLR